MSILINIEQAADTLVVGAGLAGLVIAYRLKQFGVPVEVVEARDRPGGRIHSIANALGTTFTAELGGEAFDSDHVACLSLARSLGLPVVDLWQQMPPHLEDQFWFEGKQLSTPGLQAELTALLKERKADWQAVQKFITTRTCTESITALDALSIPDYLTHWGVSRSLHQAVTTAYTIKYGMDAAAQSCLNLLCYFRQPRDCEWLFGSSDERYYIQGGNGQLPAALFAQVSDRVQLATTLEALAETPDGQYRVTLRQGQTVRDRQYRQVILTIPFSVLRQIPLQVELPPPQRRAIDTLGYNSPTKVISAYRSKVWQTTGSSGMLYTDLPIQHCWEASDSLRSQDEALLVAYPGGENGTAIAQCSLATAAQITSTALEKIFPTLPEAQLSPHILRSEWLSDPLSQGAYACYQTGQWTTLQGWEGQTQGQLLFAGEHCSRLYQGYMEGACETAERATYEVLNTLNLFEAKQQQENRLAHYQRLRHQQSKGPQEIQRNLH